MSPRLASPCSRALRRPAAAPTEHVWISDSLLSTAFERYCAISEHAGRRSIGNVPGPLESQRRLGKRRMGAGFLHGFQPPPLVIDINSIFPVDFSEWKWVPPSRARRQEKKKVVEPGEKKLSWAWLLGGTRTKNIAKEEEQEVAQGVLPFSESLDEFLASIGSAPEDIVVAEFEHICSHFSYQISLGQITEERLLSIPISLWKALESRLAGSPRIKDLSLSLLSIISEPLKSTVSEQRLGPVWLSLWQAMQSGLADCPVTKSLCMSLYSDLSPAWLWCKSRTMRDLAPVISGLWDAVDSRLANAPAARNLCTSLCLSAISAILRSKGTNRWKSGAWNVAFCNNLLVRMSELSVDDKLCDLFESVMTTIPSIHYKRLETGILAMLNTFFTHWGSTGRFLDASNASTLSDTANQALSRVELVVSSIGSSLALDARRLKARLREAQDLIQEAQHAVQTLERVISPHERHKQVILAALDFFSKYNDNALIKRVTQEVLQQRYLAISPEAGRHMAYEWLEIMARLPHVSEFTFFDQAAAIFKGTPSTESLCAEEICDLFLKHMCSQDSLQKLGRIRWFHKVAAREDHSATLAWLLVFLIRTQKASSNSQESIASFCHFLRKLKRLGDLPLAFESMVRKGKNVHGSCMWMLAYHVHDVHVALRLHDLYVKEIQTPYHKPWNPSIMGKYAKQMVSDPLLIDKLWGALDIKIKPSSYHICSQRREQRAPVILSERTAKKVAMVERLAPVLAENQHKFSNRMANRYIVQIVRYLEACKGPDGLPYDAAMALAKIATRDLEEGRPGRTIRLRWLLMVIERNFGMETAVKNGQEIMRWRRTLKMNVRAENRKTWIGREENLAAERKRWWETTLEDLKVPKPRKNQGLIRTVVTRREDDKHVDQREKLMNVLGQQWLENEHYQNQRRQEFRLEEGTC